MQCIVWTHKNFEFITRKTITYFSNVFSDNKLQERYVIKEWLENRFYSVAKILFYIVISLEEIDKANRAMAEAMEKDMIVKFPSRFSKIFERSRIRRWRLVTERTFKKTFKKWKEIWKYWYNILLKKLIKVKIKLFCL